MICMCYDFERTGIYLNSSSVQPFISFDLELYGHGNIPVVKGLENVSWYPTKEVLTEHFSIIERKEKNPLIWYEPHHELSDGWLSKLMGSNVFGNGAFLVESGSDKLKEIYDKFECFKSQE